MQAFSAAAASRATTAGLVVGVDECVFGTGGGAGAGVGGVISKEGSDGEGFEVKLHALEDTIVKHHST